jgi:hypothetical protein
MSTPSAPILQEWPTCLQTSIKFWWQPPTIGAPLLNYNLSCSAISFSQDISGDQTSYTVTGLTAGTEYSFTITATNGAGTGPAAAFPLVAAGLPPPPPSAASAIQLSSTIATVSWTPSTIAGQAPLRCYLVWALPTTGAASTFHRLQFPQLSTLNIDGLSTSTTYQFRVHGFSDPGYSMPGRTTSSITFNPPFLSTFGEVNENGTLTLSTANGRGFLSTIFASYGTPNGSLGNYTIGGCHATNSASIVSTLSFGRSTFSVQANNSVFGDPCGGTFKRLYITMLYPG